MNARSAELIQPSFAVAEKMILAPSGLDERRLSQVLDTLMSRGVEYADLYFELSREESWSLEDGIVKEGAHSIEQGVGVRAIKAATKTRTASHRRSIDAGVDGGPPTPARAIARSGGKQAVEAWQRPVTRIGCICPSIPSMPSRMRTRLPG